MSKYRIVTDATADLSKEFVEKLSLTVIPMECSLNGEMFQFAPTDTAMNPKTFYERMREGAETATSQINVFTYISAFEPILSAGEDILYIAFSSALTGSQQSARIAIDELLLKYPACKINMVDSLCASLGEGLLVYTAAQKREEGMKLAELTTWLEDNKLHLCQWFTVEDLQYLARGGRLSTTSAILGTALRIKPVLHVNNNGQLIALTKVQGRKKALKSLVEEMKKTYRTDLSNTVFLSHADCADDAAYVCALIKEQLGVDVLLVNYISPIIGAHSGPGTVALFHFGTNRG